MHDFGKDSFCLFECKDKIRIFIYESLDQINLFREFLIHWMNYYSFIIIQTLTLEKKKNN